MPKVHANGIAEINIPPRLIGCLFKQAFQTRALALHHRILQNCSGRESRGILHVKDLMLSAIQVGNICFKKLNIPRGTSPCA